MKAPTIRLSRVIAERNISHVSVIKVDAQGYDFAILKELLENTPLKHVYISKIKLECQYYMLGTPLYLSSNDCTDIINYMNSRHPYYDLIEITPVPYAKVTREVNLIFTHRKVHDKNKRSIVESKKHKLYQIV